MPADLTFNVLVFDFRGHGMSEGSRPSDFSKFLLDARAAYRHAAGLPLVNAAQIVGIGTSIGADAVVDACDDSCRGAFAVSPGSWLKVDYTTRTRELLNQGKQVRCMYSTNDGPSPAACASIETSSQYQYFGYVGIKHGMTFFVPRKMPPDFGQNILDFLQAATKP
jgi:pimeloyl-ACP methyl ester carboxylesterase